MRSRVSRRLFTLTAFGLLAASAAAQAAPCPPHVLAVPKTNQLHLVFATSTWSGFPSWPGGLSSGAISPLQPFNVADLDPSIGTTAQLRNRVTDFVVDDYCEFNVEVFSHTAPITPLVTRWQVVGVGSDAAGAGGGILFGIAQAVDTNDADPQDYSRVFAKSFKNAYGGPGDALNGSNSTLERWATAIGETTAHEAAHNYGAQHGHSAPRPLSNEDGANWHIMATGSTGLTGAIRAGRNRHFSDTEYEILGHSIGLNTKTLHNWDFVNPNNVKGTKLRVKVLSNSNSLSINWWYNGPASPWANPTVTYSGLTQSFQGNTYFLHYVDFVTPKGWNGPTAGEVLPLADFHTGATFAGSSTVIVVDAELYNGSALLPLAPRLTAYDTGDIDMGTGEIAVNFVNANLAAGRLVLEEVHVFRSPRMIDINSMMRNTAPVDIRELPVELTHVASFKNLEVGERGVRVPLGRLTDKRTVDIQYNDCPVGSVGSGGEVGTAAGVKGGAADAEGNGVAYCTTGNALSLFPATYTYIVASVVDPEATYWSPEKEDFVTGPLRNVIYYQLGGIVPDFNRNGVDDLLDIRSGKSRDEDQNGIPDDAKPADGTHPVNPIEGSRQ